MDNLCHSLIGMAASRAGLRKLTPLATSTLVIANNLPDIDVGVFATNTLAMSFRRGWTHGVLAQALLPIALTGAMLAYDRYYKKSAPGDRAQRPERQDEHEQRGEWSRRAGHGPHRRSPGCRLHLARPQPLPSP